MRSPSEGGPASRTTSAARSHGTRRGVTAATGPSGALARWTTLGLCLALISPSWVDAQAIRRDATGQAVDDEAAPARLGLSEEEARERRRAQLEERRRRERERQERERLQRERQERVRRERERQERERLEREREEQARRERIRRDREARIRREREREAREARLQAERDRREREEREARRAERLRVEREREARERRAAERQAREEREQRERDRREREEREARRAERLRVEREREARERRLEAERAQEEREVRERRREERAERERVERERAEQERAEQERAEQERERRQREERDARERAERERRARAERDARARDESGDPADADDDARDEEDEDDDDESAPPVRRPRDTSTTGRSRSTSTARDDGWAEEDAVAGDDDDDDETEAGDPRDDEAGDPRDDDRRRARPARRARATAGADDEDEDEDEDDDDDDDARSRRRAPARRQQEDDEDDDDSIPVTFGGATTLLLERRGDNGDGDATDDNYWDGILRAQAALEVGRVRLSTRIDGALFLDNPEGADRRNDIRPERVLLEGDTDLGPLTVRAAAGDFYAQLGRGLILSLRRVDEVGIDNAVRGGRLEVGGRDGDWNLQLLGGLSNPANLDNQRLLHVEDPGDILGGARVEARLEGAMLALHGAWVRVAEGADTELGADQTWAFGGEVETTLRDVTLALEMDWQARRRSGEDERGFAIYGTASAPLGPLTLLAEFKHYAEFEVMRGSVPTSGSTPFAYSAPPTAERIDQEVLDNTDVTGGRLQGDLAIGDSATGMLSAALFYDRFVDRWFSHVYGGGEHRWTSGATLSLHGGYRREWDVESGELQRGIAHGDLDGTVPVTRDWSAHGQVRHESHVDVIAEERVVFHRGTATLELDYRHQISFTGGFEWDTQGQSTDGPRTYGFGLVAWSPNDVVSLRLLAGTQRGGLKCLAGACRMYPPFAGARMDVSVRY